MQIKLMREESAWQALASDWQRLALSNHLSSPFLLADFQQAWWALKGGGERPGAELFLLVGYDRDNAIVGIAPLFRSTEDGRGFLRLIGSHEIADFLDFICAEDDLEAFLAGVLEFLVQHREEWDQLELWNLLEESSSPALLEKLCAQQGLQYQRERLQPSPQITIPETFDEYFDGLASRDAKEMRRKLRRAARYPVPVELEIVNGEDDFQQALDDFFKLMGKEVEKAAFLEGPIQEQMELIGQAAFEGGWGQLAFLRVGDKRVAGYLNFDYDNRLWAYNAGFDPAFSELSPGWLLMAKLIEWCLENERDIFDFMRGDEGYKYRFGGVDRFVCMVRITRE